jgi:hypothetical protein
LEALQLAEGKYMVSPSRCVLVAAVDKPTILLFSFTLELQNK